MSRHTTSRSALQPARSMTKSPGRLQSPAQYTRPIPHWPAVSPLPGVDSPPESYPPALAPATAAGDPVAAPVPVACCPAPPALPAPSAHKSSADKRERWRDNLLPPAKGRGPASRTAVPANRAHPPSLQPPDKAVSAHQTAARLPDKVPAGSSAIQRASAPQLHSCSPENVRPDIRSTPTPSDSRASAGTCSRSKTAPPPATDCSEISTPSGSRFFADLPCLRGPSPVPSAYKAAARHSHRSYRPTPAPAPVKAASASSRRPLPPLQSRCDPPRSAQAP